MRKHRVYEDEVREDREAWRREQPNLCMHCGAMPSWLPLAIHEIERRSHAVKRWGHRCNYLLVCTPCHEGPFATMPHARQLAVKFLVDREHYDLEEWLKLRDPGLRAPLRVTEKMVAAEVEDLAAILIR